MLGYVGAGVPGSPDTSRGFFPSDPLLGIAPATTTAPVASQATGSGVNTTALTPAVHSTDLAAGKATHRLGALGIVVILAALVLFAYSVRHHIF